MDREHERSLWLGEERLGLVALATLLVATILTYTRSFGTAPNFDEAGYTAALDAVRHGQELGTEVVTVQPPLFYLLLQLIGWLGGGDLDTLRAGMLALWLVGLIAAYAIGRRLVGPAGGVGAVALVAITNPVPTFAPLVEADPPSVALALVALALALHAFGGARPGVYTVAERLRERPILAGLAGAAIACAVLIKLFAAVAFLPILTIAFAARTSLRTLASFAAGGLLVLGLLAVTHLNAVDDFWSGAVSGQLENRDIEAPSHANNAGRLLDFFHPRIPAGYLIAAGLACAVVLAVRQRRLGLTSIWVFAAASAAFTIWMRPLLDHHLVLWAAAIALPAGAALGAFPRSTRSLRLGAVAAALPLVVLAAAFAQHWRTAVENKEPVSETQLWAADLIRTHTPPGGLTISDLPYAAVLAGRQLVGTTVDTSWGRVLTETLSADDVIDAAQMHDVHVVITGRMLRASPGLAGKLTALFPDRRTFGDATAYVR